MISPQYYSTVFLYLTICLTFWSLTGMKKKSYYSIEQGDNNRVFAFILSLILVLWIGQRPISYHFGDTVTYATTYKRMSVGLVGPEGGHDEWVWGEFQYGMAQVVDVHTFFTIVELGYIGFSLWACWRLTPNNVLISLLFVFGSFSFFTYGTNGIRNGLACAMMLTVLSYIDGNKRDKIIAIIIAFLAVNIHRTTMLPLGMMFVSLYLVKSFKQAYRFWLLSIVISLVAGGAVTAFFAGFGFDDRVGYLTEFYEDSFSRSGFRWDFLLYSMMPIILGYYVVIKRDIQDKTYTFLLNTYTLSNAFWVMVIRANFSNRFAYLSWFMYPIVLAYPLLRLDIWDESQGKYLKNIMLAQIGFTWFMQTFYWT